MIWEVLVSFQEENNILLLSSIWVTEPTEAFKKSGKGVNWSETTGSLGQ